MATAHDNASPDENRGVARRTEADEPLVVVIVGPTAVGKSDLALFLAQHFNGEVISADSRQIYRYLDIGTAKPTITERLLCPHHLVDVVAPDEEYTLASYQRDAFRAIEGTLRRGRLPLLVGGTGLYIRAVVDGLGIPQVAPRPELRAQLESRAADGNVFLLHRELFDLDPVAAARIDPRNVRRVIRALEVCLSAGRPISELQLAHRPPYRFLRLGLTCRRAVLYSRIDERVERQVANGLVEEVRRVEALGYNLTLPSMTGLGHRQVALHVQGRISMAEAIALDKHDTRRFVREQYNWFRLSDPTIHWLDREELGWDGALRRAMEIVLALESDQDRRSSRCA